MAVQIDVFHGAWIIARARARPIAAELRCCADEMPSARIPDAVRIKTIRAASGISYKNPTRSLLLTETAFSAWMLFIRAENAVGARSAQVCWWHATVLKTPPPVVVESRCCADEKPSARIPDAARIKTIHAASGISYKNPTRSLLLTETAFSARMTFILAKTRLAGAAPKATGNSADQEVLDDRSNNFGLIVVDHVPRVWNDLLDQIRKRGLAAVPVR